MPARLKLLVGLHTGIRPDARVDQPSGDGAAAEVSIGPNPRCQHRLPGACPILAGDGDDPTTGWIGRVWHFSQSIP